MQKNGFAVKLKLLNRSKALFFMIFSAKSHCSAILTVQMLDFKLWNQAVAKSFKVLRHFLISLVFYYSKEIFVFQLVRFCKVFYSIYNS